MILNFVVLVSLLSTLADCRTCQPFGLRLFYGQYFINSQASDKLNVKFNTQSSCLQSFLTFTQDFSASNISCSTQKIEVVNQTIFVTYVHTCILIKIKLDRSLTYTVYGVDESGKRFQSNTKDITLIDPNKDRKNQFLVLADWGKLYTKAYVPLKESLDLLLTNPTQIDGIILNGDIAYELTTNQCQNYLDFIYMLQQINSVWPLIMATGNHEHKSDQGYNLFLKSFQIYNQDKLHYQTYRFKHFSVLPFDPYLQMYNLSTPQQDSALVQSITNEVKNMKTPWRIVASHYPMFCSQTAQDSCMNNTKRFKELYDSFNDQHVDLFLGAHYHTYQRLYPYYKGEVILQQSPYYNINAIVSIVDGVAGNNNGINQVPYKLFNYTAAVSVNQTGFGILTVHNNTLIQYTHYSTQEGAHVYDKVSIYKSAKTRFTEKPNLKIND